MLNMVMHAVIKTAVLLLFTAVSVCFAQGNLDNVKSNTRVVKDLKDVYRAFNIIHKIDDQHELLEITEEGDEQDDLLRKIIVPCKAFSLTTFYNDTLGNFVKQYAAATIQSYNIALRFGFDSHKFKADYSTYKSLRARYEAYVARDYPNKRFESLSEDAYWKNVDKKNFIRSPDYKTYELLKLKDWKASIAELDKTISTAREFQEYSIYQIEKADQYIKHGKALDDDGKAITIYKAILDRKEYSLYLFEAWVKWRAANQYYNHGLSKSSDIPNDEYDSMRERTFTTVLKYVAAHPADEMAINECNLLATHDIVHRFGEYQYGNQNTIEYHELFDDVK